MISAHPDPSVSFSLKESTLRDGEKASFARFHTPEALFSSTVVKSAHSLNPLVSRHFYENTSGRQQFLTAVGAMLAMPPVARAAGRQRSAGRVSLSGVVGGGGDVDRALREGLRCEVNRT